MQKPDINQLAEDVEIIKKLLTEIGIDIDWTTTAKAAALLRISASTVRREIVEAEEKRILGRPVDLEYGVHYRRIRDDWQVHWSRFREVVLKTPPEKRL